MLVNAQNNERIGFGLENRINSANLKLLSLKKSINLQIIFTSDKAWTTRYCRSLRNRDAIRLDNNKRVLTFDRYLSQQKKVTYGVSDKTEKYEIYLEQQI